MGVVFPRASMTVSWSNGRRNRLAPNQPWDERAELVAERPDLFVAEPAVLYGRVRDTGVEQATAAPGEKRTTRRSKSKTEGSTSSDGEDG